MRRKDLANLPSALPARLTLLLASLYAVGYFWLSWRRFASFHAQIDLSYYLRQVWGLGHGHYDLPLVQAKNLLGLHLEPLLLPLALLGRLGVPLPPLLLGTQAVAVALLAWPAYRLGARQLRPDAAADGSWGGLGAALLALLYPTVTVATLHDFHPVTVALLPLLATIDALDEQRLGRALIMSLLSLACREDIALQLVCLWGAYALPLGGPSPLWRTLTARRQRWLLGLLLLGLLLYFFGYIVGLQPRYVPKSGSYGLHFGRLATTLGVEVHSGRDLVLALLRRPDRLIVYLLDGERLRYPLLLLGPLLLLPLLALRPLAGLLPVLAINLLSSFPGVLRLESHYTTALVPFVLGAGIIGGGRLVQALPARRWAAPALTWALLLAGLVAQVFHGGSPLAVRSARYQAALFVDGENGSALRQAVASVPPSASVAARPGVLAHLSERPRAISPPEFDDGLPVDVTVAGE